MIYLKKKIIYMISLHVWISLHQKQLKKCFSPNFYSCSKMTYLFCFIWILRVFIVALNLVASLTNLLPLHKVIDICQSLPGLTL